MSFVYGISNPFYFFQIIEVIIKKKYVSAEMSTKLFINAFISLFSHDRGGYMRCVCGGDRTPFFWQINIKNTVNRVK